MDIRSPIKSRHHVNYYDRILTKKVMTEQITGHLLALIAYLTYPIESMDK